MNNRELNHNIKYLFRTYTLFLTMNTNNKQHNRSEDYIKSEFKRLWYADAEKTITSYDNFKRLLKINSALRIIPFHQLMTYMKIKPI